MKASAISLLVLSVTGLLFFGSATGIGFYSLFLSGASDSFSAEAFREDCEEATGGDPVKMSFCMKRAESIQTGRRSGRIFALVIVALLIIPHVLHIRSLTRFLKDGARPEFEKSALWAMIPLTTPILIIGIPFGIWAKFSLKGIPDENQTPK